jgi:hypothetical protein
MKLVWGAEYSGEADYVTSWFAKAASYFGENRGRWAFVTTNSVCQGVAVPAVFSHLSSRGWQIRFAHRTFEWTSDASGKAAVHCIIVGLDRSPTGPRRLFDYPDVLGSPVELNAETINAYLVAGPEVFVRERRDALSVALGTDIRFGSMPADDGGLILSTEQYEALLRADRVAVRYLRRLVGARELLNDKERWCIWMPDGPSPDIARSEFLRGRIEHVRRFRSFEAKDAGVRSAAATPHRFSRVQQPTGAYLCVPAHVPESYEWFPAKRFGPDVIATNANFVLDDPDGFFFAVLSSRMFMTWQKAVGGRIKNDPRFASTVTWNTFPLPSISSDQRERLIEASRAVLAARESLRGRSLAAMYPATGVGDGLRGAHEELDAVMDSIFGVAGGVDLPLLQRQELLFAKYRELLMAGTLMERQRSRGKGRRR